ncbi:MAG: DUF2125 domain-containing protein [Alphaproteobacteria bacterium]|nr:DUF2125 domain-containing protein [Alphaproteobacteria bacterium]
MAMIAAFLAWSIYWYIGLSMAQSVADRELHRAAANGTTVSCRRESWGGFPFRFEFRCANPIVKSSHGITASAESLQVLAQAYNPKHLILLLDGPIAITHGSSGLQMASEGRATASVKFGPDPLPQISVEVPAPTISGLAHSGLLLFHLRSEEDDALGIAISAENLIFALMPPLVIDRADAVASLHRDQTLEIHSIELLKQATIYKGSGTLGLDSERRVAGTLQTDTNDLDGLLRIVDPYLQLSDQQRLAFKSVLGMLGQEAKAAIIAKNGELYLGPFKLGDLAPVDWR